MKDIYYLFLGIARMFERKKSSEAEIPKPTEPEIFEIEDLMKRGFPINFRLIKIETGKWLVAKLKLGEGPTGDGGGCFKAVEEFHIKRNEHLEKLGLVENDYFHVRLGEGKNIIYAKDTSVRFKKVFIFSWK